MKKILEYTSMKDGESFTIDDSESFRIEENEVFPEKDLMQNIAQELKYSETAFVKKENGHFKIRYYTPKCEVDLCGHATVSVLKVLKNEKIIENGEYKIETLCGELSVIADNDLFYLEMAEGKILKEISKRDSLEIYKALNLNEGDVDTNIKCSIVNTGLSDILLPVKSKKSLNKAVLNKEEVIKISEKYNAEGIHLYVFQEKNEITACTRNFAPICAIDEECATGTVNGALTYYLMKKGILNKSNNIFIQGEAMNKPCRIYSIIKNDKIYIGGNAVISILGNINI